MHPGLKIEMTAGTLADMTVEQFQSLQQLVGVGQWDTEREPVQVIGLGDHMVVKLTSMVIAIEKDGYSHS